MPRHLLSLTDITPAEIKEWLALAIPMHQETPAGASRPLLRDKTLAMLFTKSSLRTRVSFEMAMRQLGGYAFYIGPDEAKMGKRESPADIARVLSRYTDAIMARVYSHADILELAEYSSVPVINGLSDTEHPCQALADVMTIIERKGDLRGVNVAFVGDANNVAISLAYAVTMLGGHLSVASPQGYQLPAHVAARAEAYAKETGGSIVQTANPHSAVEDAEVVYTDVWVSMGQEAEAETRMKTFPPYQVNGALLAGARPGAIVMHCLPAHRGQEISAEVADGPQSGLWDQSENRLHAQKAVLVRLMAG